MKKFIAGLIIGIIISGNLYAFRTARPPTFTKLDDPAQLNQLNSFLQNIYDITNGRYTADVDTSEPSGTVGTEGNFKFSKVGSTYKLHAFIDGGWRNFTSD